MQEFSVIIVAGGLGTRTRQTDLPKVLAEVGGKSLLSWHLSFAKEQGAKSVVLALGHLSEMVEEQAKKLNNVLGLDVRASVQDPPKGTAVAVREALNYVDSELVFIIYADVFFKLEMVKIVNQFLEGNWKFGALVHPNDHPFDSDQVKSCVLNGRIWEIVPKGNDYKNSSNLSLSGLFIAKTLALKSVLSNSDKRDFVEIVFDSVGLQDFEVGALRFCEYAKDTGTPKRLAQVNSDIENGVPDVLAANQKRFLFLDLDNTLIENIEIKSQNSQFTIDEDVLNLIKYCNDTLITVAVVSNQPGVAKGFFSCQDLSLLVSRIEGELAINSARVDIWSFCPHHPEFGWSGERVDLKINCSCRKPNNGLIRGIDERFGVNFDSSLFLGDSWRDEGVAKSLGINFVRHVHQESLNFEAFEVLNK